MIYLLLSILCSSLIFVIFKSYERFSIDNYQAIVVNYVTASSIGFIAFDRSLDIQTIIKSDWVFIALFIGVIFISLFTVMAIVSQKQGVSVASVAVKMSVIIPVIFGIILYNEEVNLLKIIGIILALVAVFAVTYKKSEIDYKQLILLPAILFVGSGLLDAILKYSQEILVPSSELSLFSACLFGSAAFWGLVSYPLKKRIKRIELKNVLGGIALGIPNYGSIYFLLKALNQSELDSSSLFPINNVGVVILSTIFGILLFNEHISKLNWIGITLGAISILIITY